MQKGVIIVVSLVAAVALSASAALITAANQAPHDSWVERIPEGPRDRGRPFSIDPSAENWLPSLSPADLPGVRAERLELYRRDLNPAGALPGIAGAEGD